MNFEKQQGHRFDTESVLRRIGALEPERAAVDRAVRRAIDRTTSLAAPAPRPDRMVLQAPVTAAVLIAALALVGWIGNTGDWTGGWTGAAVAFADSTAAVAKTRSVKYRQVNRHEYYQVDESGRRKVVRSYGSSFTIHALPSGKYRYQDDHVVSIYDPSTGQRLTLHQASKRAFLEKVPEDAPDEPNVYADFRKVESFGLRRLGGKRIQGRLAFGFQVEQDGAPWKQGTKLWIDSETRLPVLVESSFATADGKHISSHVLDRFEWDGEIDAEIFRMTAPEGYDWQAPAQGR